MKTASGNKQETVVLQTRQKKTFNNKKFNKQPTLLIFSCSAPYILPSGNTYAKMIQGKPFSKVNKKRLVELFIKQCRQTRECE